MGSPGGLPCGGDLVGQRVSKLFPGYGVYQGSITSFNPLKGFYKVEYDDGDREDMELHEVQQFLLQETPSSNAAVLHCGDYVDDPPAASPLSSPSKIHGAAPSSAVCYQCSNPHSLPILQISNTGDAVNNLHCSAYLHRVSQCPPRASLVGSAPPLPLSQVHHIQILEKPCSSKRKLDIGCTKAKKAGRKERSIQATVTSHAALAWTTQCVKDFREDDAVNMSEHGENDTKEKTEWSGDEVLYVNSHIRHPQSLLHGYEDAESFTAFNEESPGNGVPSAHSSVSAEHAIQDSNCNAMTLPPMEPLPPSSGDFLIPQDSVLDFLEIYIFLRSFSKALFLSPFSLKSFQQCLCSHTPTNLTDSIHLCLLQALRRNLEKLAKTRLAIARGFLRHLDWNLLDVITWPLHLQAYLAAYGCEGTCNFMFALTRVEYYKLSVKNKVAVLNFLCHDVMDTYEIRAEIATRELLLIENHKENLDGMPQILMGKDFQQPEPDMGGAFEVEMLGKHKVKEKNSDECMLCGMNGDLLCCDGCPAAYHARCIGISRSTLPQGDWLCPECIIDGLDKKQLNTTGLRGGDFLGVDTHGHTFIAAWGYLLIIKPCTGSKVNYYNCKDLPMVMRWLEKMGPLYDPVKSKILHYWCLLQRNLPESCVVALQEIILKPTQTCEPSQLRGTVKGFATTVVNKSAVTETCLLALPALDLRSTGGATKFDLGTDWLIPRHCFTESRIEKLRFGQPSNSHVCSYNLVEARTDDYSSDISIVSDDGQQCFQYTNCYNQGDAAATAAANLATQNAKRKAKRNQYNEQLEAFCKSSVQFYWPDVRRQLMEVTDEKCGWCFCCSRPDLKKGCILNQASRILAAGAACVPGGIRTTKFGLGHLPAVAGYILHIEHNLKALLLGPWQDKVFRKWWRKKVKRAEDVNDLKFLLLQLESCLRRTLISHKWYNDQEKAPTCKMRLQTTRLDAVESFLLQSWKHGKKSKKIFQWYLLPSHIAKQAARQGGLKKIQGLLYFEELDWARRNQRCAWQVRVEAAHLVSQLALQVRCLDAYIRWDELQSMSRSVDTSKTDRGLPVSIYAKKWEGSVPMYLVDLNIIRRSKKTSKLAPGENADKVWVTDTQIPLLLLRTFEERLWSMRQNKYCKNTVSLSWLKAYGRGLEKDVFEYLRLNSSSCGSFNGGP